MNWSICLFEYFVFLYGVLNNKSIIYRLFQRIPEYSEHILKDYEIQVDEIYGFESLFHKQGLTTKGNLYLINQDEINILDNFNKIYRRINIDDVFVYFINPKNMM